MIEKIRKTTGKNPRLTEARAELLPGNEEAVEIANEILPNYRAEYTGIYRMNHFAFHYASKLFGHKEPARNLRKVNALIAEMNKPIIAKLKEQERKARRPANKGYVQ